MKSLKLACVLTLLAAAVLGVFSVAAYRPVVRERWAVFGTMAPGFDLPPELMAGADHHLVLVNPGAGGPPGTARWQTWHSRRRTEWAYAVALRAASRALLGEDI